ncbi:molybdate ABC transporter substrate-binding protein [soil metagenome]
MSALRATIGAVLAGFLLFACTTVGARDQESSRELLVFAAASLTEAFREIGAEFERQNEGVTVLLNFGPSDGLSTQILAGAPADVFASASERWMHEIETNGPGVQSRLDFARNSLAVIVPADNPAHIFSIVDLGAQGVKLVLATPEVPVGEYSRRALQKAGVLEEAEANVVSNEQDVKGVVQKVMLGEADAGIVYVTDEPPGVGPAVALIDIPEHLNVAVTYPIAIVGSTNEADLASRFVDFVLSEGQPVLRRFGFLPPA